MLRIGMCSRINLRSGYAKQPLAFSTLLLGTEGGIVGSNDVCLGYTAWVDVYEAAGVLAHSQRLYFEEADSSHASNAWRSNRSVLVPTRVWGMLRMRTAL